MVFMVKFISAHTGPSFETWSKILFINLLNEKGISAELYGRSHWPFGKCKYKKLSEFEVQPGDIVINDGLCVNTYFDLINIGNNYYSHGRKARALNLMRYFARYLKHIFKIVFRVRCVLYRTGPNHKIGHIYKKNISDDAKFDLNQLLALPESNTSDEELSIYLDIRRGKDVASAIKRHTASTVNIYGSILEPSYFREEIKPLLEDPNRKIRFMGLQEDDILRAQKLTANDMLDAWIDLLKK